MTDFTRIPLVHTLPAADAIRVERDHTYATEHGPLGFDLYRPSATGAPSPVVVLVSGLPDPGVIAMLGQPLKDWASYVGWARLIAASGIAVVAYTNRTPADVAAVFQHLRDHADALGIDAARIGVWACSGHVPAALAVIAREHPACAALLYGYTIDLEGSTIVADAAAKFYFAVPPVALAELPLATPLFVVRAGGDDTPGLNESLDRFVAAARARRLAITLVEHADGPHAFDLRDDSARSHEVIAETLGFLRGALGG